MGHSKGKDGSPITNTSETGRKTVKAASEYSISETVTNMRFLTKIIFVSKFSKIFFCPKNSKFLNFINKREVGMTTKETVKGLFG